MSAIPSVRDLVVCGAAVVLLLAGFSGVLLAQPQGGALQFESSKNDYARIPATPSMDVDSFTLEVWALRNTPLLDQHCAFFRSANGVGMANGLVLTYGYDGHDAWTVFVGGHPITGKKSHPLDEWAHIAVVYDGGSVTLYQDGYVIAQEEHSVDLYWDSDIFLGVELDCDEGCMDPNQAMAGILDEVSLWSRPLSKKEVQSSRRGRLARSHASLVGHWAFDERSGLRVFDTSGKENHGWLGTAREDDLTVGRDILPNRVRIGHNGSVRGLRNTKPEDRIPSHKCDKHPVHTPPPRPKPSR